MLRRHRTHVAACDWAAEFGHLENLKEAHERGCSWDEVTCSIAAQSGQLACLKYMHENGCPWDEHTCSLAAMNKHFDCLQYAYEHGCRYPAELRPQVARTILLPKWRAHVHTRRIAFYWYEQAVRTACAPEGPARKRDRAAFEAEFV